jgi:drug/metabolite transporter (DMT)-like permease
MKSTAKPIDYIILLLGVATAATAIIMIKKSSLSPVYLAGLRLILAAFITLPFFIKEKRKEATPIATVIKSTWQPGLALGTHFILWTQGARMIPAANASLVVNMMPIFMPFTVYLIFREKINTVEIFATFLAMIGLGFIVIDDISLSSDYFLGNLVCMAGMILLTIYLALGKRRITFKGLWIYLTPLYFFGGVFCLATEVAIHGWELTIPPRDFLAAILLAIFPTVIGHGIFNRSMRIMRPQIVSLINLFQVAFAGLYGYFLFHEIPEILFIPALIFILGGSVIAIKGQSEKTGASVAQ